MLLLRVARNVSDFCRSQLLPPALPSTSTSELCLQGKNPLVLLLIFLLPSFYITPRIFIICLELWLGLSSLHIKVIPPSRCLQETLTAFPLPWLFLLLMSLGTSEAHNFEAMEKEQGQMTMQSFSLSGMTTYQELLLQAKFSLVFRMSKTSPNLMQLLETRWEHLLSKHPTLKMLSIIQFNTRLLK